MTTATIVLMALTSCANGADADHERALQQVAPAVVTLAALRSYGDLLADVERAVDSDVELEVDAEARRGTYDGAIATGIVLDDAGHVITTASFAASSGPLHAISSAGQVIATRLVALDSATDLAILQLVDARPAAAHFATDTRALRENTKLCIIAAGRSRRCLATSGRLKHIRTNIGAGRMHDFLYLDTEPAPGAAGGAVVNADGEVVGMVSALVQHGGTLVVPAATIVYTADSLLTEPVNRRAGLGVTIFSPADADPHPTRGVKIDGVRPDGAAARAGIDINDVIVAYNDVAVDDVVALKRLVRESNPGDVVAIRIRRDHLEHQVEVALDALQPAPYVLVRIAAPSLGIITSNLTVEGRIAGESVTSRGMKIEEVQPAGAADTASLRPGDVITAIAGALVHDRATLAGALRVHQPGETVTVDIVRNGQREAVALVLGGGTKVVWLPSDHGQLRPEDLAQIVGDDGLLQPPAVRLSPVYADSAPAFRQDLDRMRVLVTGPPR